MITEEEGKRVQQKAVHEIAKRILSRLHRGKRISHASKGGVGGNIDQGMGVIH